MLCLSCISYESVDANSPNLAAIIMVRWLLFDVMLFDIVF